MRTGRFVVHLELSENVDYGSFIDGVIELVNAADSPYECVVECQVGSRTIGFIHPHIFGNTHFKSWLLAQIENAGGEGIIWWREELVLDATAD